MIYLNRKTEADYNANYIHFEVTAPVAQSETVTVPLRDGFVNLTPMLSDEIHYNSRTLTIGLELRSLRGEWPMYWSQLLRDLHGKEITVIRSEDPNYFWIGTASVGALEDHGASAGVTITVEAQPFKRTVAYVEDEEITVSGPTSYTVENNFMRGYPEFECSSAMTVTLGSDTWVLPIGESTAYGMHFSDGENELEFDGSGIVRMKWRGGLL